MAEKFLVYIEEVDGEAELTEEEAKEYRALCKKVRNTLHYVLILKNKPRFSFRNFFY